MRRFLLVLIFVLVNLTSTYAVAADWKFCGGAILMKGEKTISFYDSESVERTTEGTIKFWVKTIKQSVFDKALKKKEKLVIEKAANKVVAKYVPPYAFVNQKTSYDDSIEIITWEELGNYQAIQPRAKLFFEINCVDRKIRTLSGVSYKNNGEIESNSKIGEWNFVSPESTGETLHKILCK